MSDQEKIDLVVPGLTHEEMRLVATGHADELPGIAAVARAAMTDREREERDATSYTDDDGSIFSIGPAYIHITSPTATVGALYVTKDHGKLAAVINAARERDGLPRLVEESGDGACSDPTCSYRAEMDGLSAACKGMGCQVGPVLSEVLLAAQETPDGRDKPKSDRTAEAEAWVQRTAQKTDEWVARQRSTYSRAEEPCGSESADVRVRAFQKVPQETQAKAIEAATAEIAAEAGGEGGATFEPSPEAVEHVALALHEIASDEQMEHYESDPSAFPLGRPRPEPFGDWLPEWQSKAQRVLSGLPGVVSAEEHARLLRDWTHLREAADSRIAQCEADRDSYRVSKNLMQEQRDEQLERADRAEAARDELLAQITDRTRDRDKQVERAWNAETDKIALMRELADLRKALDETRAQLVEAERKNINDGEKA
jgi:hypothetical protein